jgi:hypothetical protein
MVHLGAVDALTSDRAVQADVGTRIVQSGYTPNDSAYMPGGIIDG